VARGACPATNAGGKTARRIVGATRDTAKIALRTITRAPADAGVEPLRFVTLATANASKVFAGSIDTAPAHTSPEAAGGVQTAPCHTGIRAVDGVLAAGHQTAEARVSVLRADHQVMRSRTREVLAGSLVIADDQIPQTIHCAVRLPAAVADIHITLLENNVVSVLAQAGQLRL